MFDKKHIETILKLNGIGTGSPDEQIRSVLLSARFNNDEVETALMVLKQNMKTNETHVDGLHKVFRSDQTLKASEISQLLGVDVNIDETIQLGEGSMMKRRFTIVQVLILWFVSMILAITGVLFYMFTHDIGVFHPSSNMVLMSE
jgi:hypothetical protein